MCDFDAVSDALAGLVAPCLHLVSDPRFPLAATRFRIPFRIATLCGKRAP
jgi:hypothetical protein